MPLFFYLLHLYVIHGTAVAVTAMRGQDYHIALPLVAWFHAPASAGYGFGLPGTYAALLFTLTVLYWPCRYFGELKRTSKAAWLKYL